MFVNLNVLNLFMRVVTFVVNVLNFLSFVNFFACEKFCFSFDFGVENFVIWCSVVVVCIVLNVFKLFFMIFSVVFAEFVFVSMC